MGGNLNTDVGMRAINTTNITLRILNHYKK
jgi:hypothetical protein